MRVIVHKRGVGWLDSYKSVCDKRATRGQTPLQKNMTLSPFALMADLRRPSRVVLVTKKDGTVRFCTDYRDLNSKLQREDSPLPLTAEAIDRLSSGQEKDKYLTAFNTHRGKFEYSYLPFGLQSGPSYMCRVVMDAVLEGLAWDICMPYLDDIGIFSTGTGATLEERKESSFQQMLHRLDLVLERLIWAGLTCKMTKCTFFIQRAR
eukprot:scaffold10057_cov140-Isochrysis_galbana.AAC.2